MHCDLQEHFVGCRDVKTVAVAIQLLRERLRMEFQRLSDVQRDLWNAFCKAQATEVEFTTTMVGKEEALERSFSALEALISEAKAAAFHQFRAALSSRGKLLSEHVGALETRWEHLRATLKQLPRLIESGTCAEVGCVLNWSQRYSGSPGWNTMAPLQWHIDTCVDRTALKAAVDASWAVTTEKDAAQVVSV
jgi:inorganic triphosphatase YgiF